MRSKFFEDQIDDSKYLGCVSPAAKSL
jgi:hypothetical protein